MPPTPSKNIKAVDDQLKEILKWVPANVGEEITQQWRAIARTFSLKHRGLPNPAWAAGFKEDGPTAWERIGGRKECRFSKNISVYLHVPFCNRRCGFCDCISISLKDGGTAAVRRFTEKIVAEIRTWASVLGSEKHPVTTVHFGGGTPTILGPNRLNEIVEALRVYPGADDTTEWALETTSRTLRGFGLDRIKEMGFSRLHIGVQTLDDACRTKLGRRDSSRIVLETITAAMDMGFVVSVDLIYGLPGQRFDLFFSDLKKLVAIGIHGVSLYELQVSQRNHSFLQGLGMGDKNSENRYLYFQAGESYLKDNGFKKNHFVHFARPSDRQRYYRHAIRSEDLLSFGPTADGRFGHYLYRHHDYHEYMSAAPPGLAGGMFESDVERFIHRAKSDLMAGAITRKRIKEVAAGSLLALWVAHDFLATAPGEDRFDLTANGSWFLALMLTQLHQQASKQITNQSLER